LKIDMFERTAMQKIKRRLAETIDFIKSKLRQAPYIGLLTGTGLSESADSMAIDTVIDYKNIPHFPLSTVQTHIGRMLSGNMNGCPVIAMQGRFHLYEGYSPLEVTYPIRVMQQLGVKVLILSNAAGGLNPKFSAGEIMLITDHINLTGSNPLIGPNEDSWGMRFPDMSRAYNQELIIAAESIAKTAGAHLRKGIYVGLATFPRDTGGSEVFTNHRSRCRRLFNGARSDCCGPRQHAGAWALHDYQRP
jgi:purine-nucleoside phosphorylase